MTDAPLPLDWWGLGIDVGGTKTAAAVVGPTGILQHSVSLPTPAQAGPEAVLDTMAEAARSALHKAGRTLPAAVGVSTGGVIDSATGTVVSATDLLRGWAGTAVGAGLSKRLDGVAVAVDNDGNALGLGESRFGAARGLDDVLFAAVGTGVAGALILSGRLVRGAHHTAGELGHLPAVGADDRRCSCGRLGHLEAAAAGPSMTARFRSLRGDPTATDLPAVTALAVSGDSLAETVLREGASVLGRTLGGLVNLLDPDAVVVGGGVMACGDLYRDALETAFRSELLPGVDSVPLLPASAGPLAAVAGAALLPLELP